jgi:hypothetical protein
LTLTFSGVAALAPNNQTGNVAGNSLSTWTDCGIQAYTRIKEEGVDDSPTSASSLPTVTSRTSVLLFSHWQLLTALVTGAYRQGFSGSVAGIPIMFTQQLPNLTTGTRTNGTVAGAAQNVNYSCGLGFGRSGSVYVPDV